MLTDRFIRNAKPGLYADENGLYLQVYSSGTKAFLYRTQAGGKQVKQVVGHYPKMSLSEARDAVERIKLGVVTRTVKDAFSAYYKFLCTQYEDPAQTKRMFDKDLLPHVGEKDIETVTRAAWTGLIQAIVDRGSPTMANRVLTQLKRFLTFCEQRGWIENNPLDKVLRRNIGGKEKPRERTLTEKEIVEAMCKICTHSVSLGTKWALYGILLTGCRSSEVLCLTNGELRDTKNGRPHKIPLTTHVRAWLKIRPKDVPKDHRVLSRALKRLDFTFTPHDLRRTFATRLSELGIGPHIVEKMLNHQMVGVMAVYNRAEYWPERYEAQSLWDSEMRVLRKKTPDEPG